MSEVAGRHSTFTAASGELTPDEISMLYRDVLNEAEGHFLSDPSYLIDIATSGSQAASRRERRTRVPS